MSDFVAGIAARHDAAALAMRAAFAITSDFAPADLRLRAAARAPVGFKSQPGGPRHFSPADPAVNPTAGWNPLDATAEPADVHATILSTAADLSSSFLVLGGYGHSPLGECVLGGTTREIFRSLTIPALMSH